ncbi:hypothetical protein VA596_10415 [Amycolatopsis sp., V23-08]|uniref:Uncharacterized protein n=1 Tax=Amycolatopsis heterodermiae TaxID=3110235 RepID=A0ABU5R186_9PSEU|nr:hypothetical protein [Amycolatopsis sp., V23-08]MEA5359951.1 hypothetical protein [Amycolatopsis sp., V23-08]
MPQLVTRRITPAGFLLALLLFLFLPCLAASCDAPDGTRTEVGYSGADLVTGQQKITGVDGLGLTPAQQAAVADKFDMPVLVQVLAIVAAVLLVLGLGTALLRTPKARALTAVVVSGTGAVLLVVTEVFALGNLTDNARLISATVSSLSSGQGTSVEDEAVAAVELRLGFWLSVSLLLLVFLLNVLVALRRAPVTADAE